MSTLASARAHWSDNYGLRYELRNLIFNAEMALCDLRAFGAGASDSEAARERVAELRATAEKMAELLNVHR